MAEKQERFRVAIAGCHRMVTRTPGSHNFATAFHNVPETEVVGVFDLGADTRAEFVDCWGDVPTYDDYPRMLEEIKPELLCIATRQTMHADQIELAVRAGVQGILCDKPLVTSLAEMDRVVRACERVPLLFALDRRWFTRYRDLRTRIAGGVIGPITNIVAYGLPNLINHGPHWYDTLLALAGDIEPTWVSGLVDDVSAEPEDSRRRMDASGRGQIGLANGVVLYITADGRHAGSGLSMSFEVVGEKGRLFILNDANESFIWLAEGGLGVRPLELPTDTEPWPAGPAMVKDLVQAVQTGSRTSCDVGHARRATEIGFAIHASSAAGGAKIDLPVEHRSFRVESFPWGNE